MNLSLKQVANCQCQRRRTETAVPSASVSPSQWLDIGSFQVIFIFRWGAETFVPALLYRLYGTGAPTGAAVSSARCQSYAMLPVPVVNAATSTKRRPGHGDAAVARMAPVRHVSWLGYGRVTLDPRGSSSIRRVCLCVRVRYRTVHRYRSSCRALAQLKLRRQLSVSVYSTVR